jgi:hypothetical protein
MALRPVSELGLADATDVGEPTNGATGASAPAPPRPRPAPSSRPRRARREPAPADQTAATRPRIKSAERPELPLSDQPTVFVQVMVTGELHERLTETSHRIAAEQWKLRHQKKIIGALVWRHVKPDDAESIRLLGGALDEFLETDVAEAPAEVKVGTHMPFSLKHNLDGAALALRRTRRAASGRTLLSTLIWRYVRPENLDELLVLLEEYHEASRPRPRPLGFGETQHLSPTA